MCIYIDLVQHTRNASVNVVSAREVMPEHVNNISDITEYFTQSRLCIYYSAIS